MGEIADRYRRRADAFERLIAGVRPEQWASQATPPMVSRSTWAVITSDSRATRARSNPLIPVLTLRRT